MFGTFADISTASGWFDESRETVQTECMKERCLVLSWRLLVECSPVRNKESWEVAVQTARGGSRASKAAGGLKTGRSTDWGDESVLYASPGSVLPTSK